MSLVHTGPRAAAVRVVHTGPRAAAVSLLHTGFRTADEGLVHTGLRTAAVRLVQIGLRGAVAVHTGLRGDTIGLDLQADEGMLQQGAWCDALVAIQVEQTHQQVHEAGLDTWAGLNLQVKSEMIEKRGHNMALNALKTTT